jgi:hypothetical protein
MNNSNIDLPIYSLNNMLEIRENMKNKNILIDQTFNHFSVIHFYYKILYVITCNPGNFKVYLQQKSKSFELENKHFVWKTLTNILNDSLFINRNIEYTIRTDINCAPNIAIIETYNDEKDICHFISKFKYLEEYNYNINIYRLYEVIEKPIDYILDYENDIPWKSLVLGGPINKNLYDSNTCIHIYRDIKKKYWKIPNNFVNNISIFNIHRKKIEEIVYIPYISNLIENIHFPGHKIIWLSLNNKYTDEDIDNNIKIDSTGKIIWINKESIFNNNLLIGDNIIEICAINTINSIINIINIIKMFKKGLLVIKIIRNIQNIIELPSSNRRKIIIKCNSQKLKDTFNNNLSYFINDQIKDNKLNNNTTLNFIQTENINENEAILIIELFDNILWKDAKKELLPNIKLSIENKFGSKKAFGQLSIISISH